MSDEWIRASEIPNYVFCRRAWWLKRTRHVQPANMRELKQGTQHHASHGRTVKQVQVLKRTAVVLFVIVLALAAYRFLLL